MNEAGLRARLAEVLAREGAATEQRHWVRLTRRCNNRCLFCHDALSHDGTVVPTERVYPDIRSGRDRGATRLVLSGGEPTIHPQFIEAIAYGREAGYRWVQAISNGRMFAYDRFTARAVEAGLDEATLSVHGHTAELHDALVGAPGAFAQTLRGLRSLQRAGRVVSVDIVACKPNVRHLAAMLRFFLGLGVTEFDLLHLVPFGRAHDEHRGELYFDPALERHHILEALEIAKVPGVHVWTNRWPAPLLEGAEQLVQDPHKILDEVRGTFEAFAAYVDTGIGPGCRGERCDRCFLADYCRALFDTRARLVEGRFDVVVLDAVASPLAPGAREAVGRQRTAALRVRAPDVASAAEAVTRSSRGETAPLELDFPALEGLPPSLARRTRRAVLRREEDLASALGLPAAEIEIPLERATAELARLAIAVAPDRAIVTMPGKALLSETMSAHLAPAEVRAVASRARAEGLAQCLAPRSAFPRATLDVRDLRRDGSLDLLAWAERYVRELYRTRSLRCAACPMTAGCPGAHVNYVRAHGFAWMHPPGTAPAS